MRRSNLLFACYLTVFSAGLVSATGCGKKTEADCEDKVCGGESESSAIGPEGGTIEVEGHRLEIPPGALTEMTDITMTVAAEGNVGGESEFVSDVVNLEPSGLEFRVPGTLFFPFKQTPQGEVAVLWDHEGQVNIVPSTPAAAGVSARVVGFSTAAVSDLFPSACFWSPVRKDFGEDCDSQTIDEPLVCAVLEWGGKESPKTTLSFGNHDPSLGHIRLDRVVVEGDNVLPIDLGERSLGPVSESATGGWIWEVASEIDDTALPAEWQDHTRIPSPNEFEVWPESDAVPMSYCANVDWSLLNETGISQHSTQCCYEGGGTDTGEPEMCLDERLVEGTNGSFSALPIICDGSGESLHPAGAEEIKAAAETLGVGLVDLGVDLGDGPEKVYYAFLGYTFLGRIYPASGSAACGTQAEPWTSIALEPGTHELRIEAYGSEACTYLNRDDVVYVDTAGETVTCNFSPEGRAEEKVVVSVDVAAGECQQLSISVENVPDAILKAWVNGAEMEFQEVEWRNALDGEEIQEDRIRGYVGPDTHRNGFLEVSFPSAQTVGEVCTLATNSRPYCRLRYALDAEEGTNYRWEYQTGDVFCEEDFLEVTITRSDAEIMEGTFVAHASQHNNNHPFEPNCSVPFEVTEGYFQFPADRNR